MQNATEIFKIALGLNEPWQIDSVSFDKENKVLNIQIKFTKGTQFSMPDDMEYSAYDKRPRTWQHLNFFEHKCFIHCDVPRVQQADGKTTIQEVPWARKGSGFTLLFEAFAMLLIENEMPVNKVGKVLKVVPNRLWRMFDFWIERAHNADEINKINQLGYDETSMRKGHNYITTTVDIKERRVLYASEGKDANCIKESTEYLASKGVKTDEIEHVCIDMSPSFISGCTKYLPKTAITFDRFHVVKEVNKAMDELRKGERKMHEILKGHRYTFLKNKLSPERRDERDRILELYPKLGEGYRLKTMFTDFWEMKNKEKAAAYLAFWCDQATESGIFPFQQAVGTIKRHWSGIMNYIESKISNGILEGLNSKIQLAKKRARGFAKTKNFINMIYFICGKLKFDYPLYSS